MKHPALEFLRSFNRPARTKIEFLQEQGYIATGISFVSLAENKVGHIDMHGRVTWEDEAETTK